MKPIELFFRKNPPPPAKHGEGDALKMINTAFDHACDLFSQGKDYSEALIVAVEMARDLMEIKGIPEPIISPTPIASRVGETYPAQ